MKRHRDLEVRAQGMTGYLKWLYSRLPLIRELKRIEASLARISRDCRQLSAIATVQIKRHHAQRSDIRMGFACCATARSTGRSITKME